MLHDLSTSSFFQPNVKADGGLFSSGTASPVPAGSKVSFRSFKLYEGMSSFP